MNRMQGRDRRPILCVGVTPALQALWQFDAFRPGEVNRAHAFTTSAAGKGVNVAHVLQTLGGQPLLLGFAGGDSGRRVISDLDRWRIRHDLVRVAVPTRTCHTLRDRSSGLVTELVEESALPTRNDWERFFRKYRARLARAALVVIAGALMPRARQDIYRRLAKLAADRDVPLIIDSQREPLQRALEYRPLVAKLNVQELENTLDRKFRSERGIIRGARQLIAAGARQVVLTDGPRGAWLIDHDRVQLFRPPRVSAVNPIGSGDAVTAGLAYGLASGRDLTAAVRLGIACGTANAVTLLAGTVKKPDVTRLEQRVRVTPVMIDRRQAADR